MRLNRLDLTRYGKFTDVSLDFGPARPGKPDFHIVYGLNEAGKSTAFSAYLDLLFGIPERSGYNFLHAYNAMQVGGVIETEGGVQSLARIKQRSGSLIDGRGNPVNEALLSSALGGVGRDAYRTMFSLDEHSLREGGESIVQSRGDLGELLFSASAGLSDVSRALSALHAEADALYKKRARSTELHRQKQMLASLKEKRAEIDIQATAYSQLTAAAARTEAAYREAEAERAGAETALADLERRLRALPAARQLAQLGESLSAMADLPRLPQDILTALPRLAQTETRLRSALSVIGERLERLEAQAGAIAVDRTILSEGTAFARLEELRPRFQTAEADLPRRRAALDEQNAAIAHQLRLLGQADHPDPGALVLDAVLTGRLRDLIERRSGLDTALKASSRELERINAALDALADAPERQAPGPASRHWPTVARLAGELKRSDRHALLRQEKREIARLGPQCDDWFSRLHPWTGDARALAALRFPDRRQLETWRSAAADLARRIGAHQERRRQLAGEIADARARKAAMEAGGAAFDDQSAAESRAARDRAWRAHRETLDAASAARFEEAMTADDRTTEARLARANDLAALRQLDLRLAVSGAAVDREAILLEEAQAEEQALRQTIAAQVPPVLMPEALPLADAVAGLQAFADGRASALQAAADLDEAKARADALEREIAAALSALSAALLEAGAAVRDNLDAAELHAAAEDVVNRAQSEEAEAERREKRLAELTRDADERRRDFDMASASMQDWAREWQAALDRSWLAPDLEPADVRAVLDALAALPGLLRERDQLQQRILLMEEDEQVFADELQALAGRLGADDGLLPHASLFTLLAERRSAAQRQADAAESKAQEITETRHEAERLDAEAARHREDVRRALAAIGTETLEEALQRLDAIAERDRLERRTGELRLQIIDDLGASTAEEALDRCAALPEEEMQREAATLRSRVELLTVRVRELYAEWTLARNRLDAVGGDGAVAALEAERATVLLDMEETAWRYLKLKTGLLAAGSALDLYREKHRSSMMKRASEAFRQITRGEYSGLAARPEKDRETLIGLTRDGGSRLTDAMSTGTKYQLYLALRLAGYEEFAEVRPPVPFIADDIMETFDEPRSEEVFRLFGDMARIGQVIYLTHHRHLCDIARRVVPDVNIIPL